MTEFCKSDRKVNGEKPNRVMFHALARPLSKT